MNASTLLEASSSHLEELGVLVLQQQNVLFVFLHFSFSRHFLQLQLLPGSLLLIQLFFQVLRTATNIMSKHILH